MQALSAETLLELKWRDWFIWLIGGRLAGMLYEKISAPAVWLVAFVLRTLISPFDRKKALLPYFEYGLLKREIFTLANIVTAYGLFLTGELLALSLYWFLGKPLPDVYSLGLALWGTDRPFLAIAYWLLIEIFVSDFIDGPLARINGAVTALGTLLDHYRDYKASFIALGLLISVTFHEMDYTMVILEILMTLGFAGIMLYHTLIFIIKWRECDTASAQFSGRFAFVRDFALNEYQTDLLGRVQFFVTASAIASGLFYYFTHAFYAKMVFDVSVAMSLFVTGWYFGNTRTIYEKKWQHWHKRMREKSRHLKQRVVYKTLPRRSA